MPRRPPTHTGSSGLQIGGFERWSAVDWPGQLAAVVFCQGCLWRCRYCHNPHLIPRSTPGRLAWGGIHAWLEGRRGLLDAVVFSGGEPTLQTELVSAAGEVRSLGFKVGLHTAGPSPENLAKLLPLLDWVGFDFKAPFGSYQGVTGRPHGARASESLQMLRSARIPCEVRTTWHPSILSVRDLAHMARSLAESGCTEWVIQRFHPEGCADEDLRGIATGPVPLNEIQAQGLTVSIRDQFADAMPADAGSSSLTLKCSLDSIPK